LLILLGILLLILLTILLVPVRYRVAIEHGETFRMEGRASWLLHLIHAKFSYLEGKPHIRMRIFGFVLYDNLKLKVKKTKNKKIKNKKIKRKKVKSAVKKKNKRKSKTKTSAELKKEKILINDNKSDTIRIVQTHKQIEEQERNLIEKSMDELPEDLRKSEIYEEKYKQEEQHKREEEHKQEEQHKQEELRSKVLDVSKTTERQEKQNTQHKKISFLMKILLKIKSWKEKVLTFFRELKSKIIKWFDTVVNIKQKFSLISNFIKDELNREGFHITYHSLKKMLKHILPTKLKSKLIFGTGDPCMTGQALGLAGMLYSFYGDKIQIIPDFENARLEGKHDARGRIRLITILIIVIKLIFDKRFKQLKRNFILLKEAL
jgi:hypothetical protein